MKIKVLRTKRHLTSMVLATILGKPVMRSRVQEEPDLFIVSEWNESDNAILEKNGIIVEEVMSKKGELS